MHRILLSKEIIHFFYKIFLHEKSSPEELLFFVEKKRTS